MNREFSNNNNFSNKELTLPEESQHHYSCHSSSSSSKMLSDSELPDYLNFKNFCLKDDEPKTKAANSSQNVTFADIKEPVKGSSYKAFSSENVSSIAPNNIFQNYHYNQFLQSSTYLPFSLYNSYYNPYSAYNDPFYYHPMQYPSNQSFPSVKVKERKVTIEKLKIHSNLLNLIEKNEINILKKIICSSEGSENIQKLIKESNEIDLSEFISYIESIMEEIMTNHHGNYACQTLFSNLNTNQRKMVWKIIEKKVISLSNTDYSTYCIQVLIESISDQEEEKYIISLFKENFMLISFNKQGNHIIKSLLKTLRSKALKTLTNFLLNNFEVLSQNVYGISIIKKFIEHAFELNIKPIMKKIKDIISHSFKTIISHEYSHYSILHIIDVWGIKSSGFIIKAAKSIENLVLKYNSRVIYKIVDKMNSVSY